MIYNEYNDLKNYIFLMNLYPNKEIFSILFTIRIRKKELSILVSFRLLAQDFEVEYLSNGWSFWDNCGQSQSQHGFKESHSCETATLHEIWI